MESDIKEKPFYIEKSLIDKDAYFIFRKSGMEIKAIITKDGNIISSSCYLNGNERLALKKKCRSFNFI